MYAVDGLPGFEQCRDGRAQVTFRCTAGSYGFESDFAGTVDGLSSAWDKPGIDIERTTASGVNREIMWRVMSKSLRLMSPPGTSSPWQRFLTPSSSGPSGTKHKMRPGRKVPSTRKEPRKGPVVGIVS